MPTDITPTGLVTGLLIAVGIIILLYGIYDAHDEDDWS